MERSYTALEQSILSELGPGAVPSFSTSAAVDLFTTTNFLYSFAIMLIVVVAGWRYMLAGIWRMQASQAGMTKSNNEFRRVTLGLLGVLSLFLILYTFNKGLLKGDVGLEGLKSRGAVNKTTTEVPTETKAPTTSVTNGTEKANRDTLTAAGITVNKDACTPAQMQEKKPSCTNLADLGQSAMSMLVQLPDSCSGASIVVTGGTEPGHNTHGPGKSVVDLRIGGSVLDTCIKKKSVPGPTLGYCNATYVWLGFIFCDEKGTDHWHVYK